MTRARETGDIIRSSLPNVPFEYCDFLREGAPCIPEPPSSTWRPENQVSKEMLHKANMYTCTVRIHRVLISI